MTQKDSRSREQANELLKTSLKDTVSKSIKALVINTSLFWDNIHATSTSDRTERAAAWNELNKVHAHNENVEKLIIRIGKDFFEIPPKRIEEIKRLAEEVVPLLDKAASDLRGFCHHDHCEHPDGCPSDHDGGEDEYGDYEINCQELLNLMSPFYWMAARELADIARDVKAGVIENLDYPFALVFALSQSIYRYHTLYNLAGMETFHSQHDDNYDERGLKEFYKLREGTMWMIKELFGRLSILLDYTAQELKEYAEAWKLKEPKKEE